MKITLQNFIDDTLLEVDYVFDYVQITYNDTIRVGRDGEDDIDFASFDNGLWVLDQDGSAWTDVTVTRL